MEISILKEHKFQVVSSYLYTAADTKNKRNLLNYHKKNYQ